MPWQKYPDTVFAYSAPATPSKQLFTHSTRPSPFFFPLDSPDSSSHNNILCKTEPAEDDMEEGNDPAQFYLFSLCISPKKKVYKKLL